MRTRIFWGFFSLLALSLVIIFTYSIHEQWEVYSKGNIVDVTVIALPNRLATNGTMKFEFQGKIHSKKIDGNASTYMHIGDKIQMRHLEGRQIFMYVNDNPLGWGIFVLLFMLVSALYCAYYALKKDTPPVKVFGKKIA